ncbi:hypothetical protein NG798_08705 [Ancylothrix sp. C2]|uniref:hypothetical protein n=1 Tax=Ancylothrix sp. D3o TaxID=2953691 RepID=UPI0021BA9343|nr:hypothetical protein [Ancylothrix sp. D3o]MCT7949865.1 hypothetical protein [Ancylothrix sp. D3o]
MQLSEYLSTISLEQVVERIFSLRQITRFDQRLLMTSLLSKDLLTEADHKSINKVFDGLQQGLIKVAD